MPTHSALGALARECFGTSSRVERIQSAASSELSPSRSNDGLDASELSKLAVRLSEPDACEGEGDGELSSPLRRRPTTSATSASACRRRARARSAALSSLAAARRSNASRRASSVGALARTLACAMQRRRECETRRVAWTCAEATTRERVAAGRSRRRRQLRTAYRCTENTDERQRNQASGLATGSAIGRLTIHKPRRLELRADELAD